MSNRINAALFYQQYQQGLTDSEIARLHGVSTRAIHAHRSRLGLPSKFRRKTDWTCGDVAKLRKLVAAGNSVSDIAKALNCGDRRIRSKVSSLGLRLAVVQSCKRYSTADDAAILRGYDAGKTDRAIARKLGRTEKGVSMRRLKLVEVRSLQEEIAAAEREAARVVVRAPKMADLYVPRPDDGLSDLAALSDRVGAKLVADLAKVDGAKTYAKLDEVAKQHKLPFQRVQSLWHQVRVS